MLSRRARAAWYLYDLANQMFPFIVISFVFNPWIVETLGARDAAFLLTFSGSMVAALLLAPVVGAVSDRIGRRPILVTMTLMAVASIALLGIGAALGLPRGASLTLALLFFATANLGFQLAVVAYDAFLPAVAGGRLGLTGGIGIGVGYVGSFLALGLMFLVLGVLGLGEPALFALAAALFLALALPAFLFLRDARRPNGLGPAFAGVLQTLRGLPRQPVLGRFLLIRFFYADAVNTMILVMGVYAVQEVGFARDGAPFFALLGLGIGAAVAAAPLWGLLVDRIGPRHTLSLVLMGWCLTFLLAAIHPVLGLPQELFYVVGALVGVFLAGTWTSDRPLLVGIAPPKRIGEWFGLYAIAGRFAAVTGPVTWALVVDVALRDRPGARQVGILTLLATVLLALWLLRRLPDPLRPGPGPGARIGPWGDGGGRRLRRPWHVATRAPFVLLYLLLTWVVFFAMAPRPAAHGILRVAQGRLEDFLFFDRLYFWLPDVSEAPLTALASLATAPFVNVHLVQLVYVTVLLLFFGVVFEVREGTKRIVAVFFGAAAAGALAASLLHLAVYPHLLDLPVLEQAQRMLWSGGSAGAFGVMGAVAARARNPWPLLAFLVVWELNVGGWYLRSYTPAFHLSALAAGFLFTRRLPAWRGGGPSSGASGSESP